MLFTGHYEHVIDEKNRLAIPATIRNQMEPERDGKRLYLLPSGQPGVLRLYPETYFRRLSDRLEQALVHDEDLLALEQAMFPLAELLEMDSAGRVGIPPEHLRLAKMEREVTVAGVRDHLEIVNRALFRFRMEEHLQNYAEIHRKAREAMFRNQNRTGHSTGD